MAAKDKPLDWRENLALLVEYTRRQAIATEQLAKELRDIKEIYRESGGVAARVAARVAPQAAPFLSGAPAYVDPGEDTT